ncbi:GNAT family N-acetyltransferase [Hymenobacter psychrotolerans]|uniref:Acetyltransferase (GNAT) family protein n=1 Tax=Hymenobacter psychrotolerans DSM 18569 TaxID=1121959 RepID=A0A1M6WR58_9BACT|nr:GNAT family N-acetyltransferase [Hymenobacter psychrotolerans]SHK96069.1 Acetyltransferase (GNAT) family protein [Hymenobacter psychrotolerans DSM 18569]
MTIRLATPQDLPELYRLWRLLMDQHRAYHPVFGYHPEADFKLKRVLRERLAEPYTRIFVADAGPDGLVGLLLATYQVGTSAMHFFRRGYIAETIVEVPYRRRGLGRALFSAAKTWLLAEGADHLELQVALQNPAALHFWQAQGFAVTTHHLVRPLTDGNSLN